MTKREQSCARLNAEWRKKVGTEVPCSEEGAEPVMLTVARAVLLSGRPAGASA